MIQSNPISGYMADQACELRLLGNEWKTLKKLYLHVNDGVLMESYK